MQYFVSAGGDDTSPGSAERPFRTVGKGISVLLAGDVLNLRHGVYIGPVAVTGKQGTPDNPIVIRSVPDEHAYIDGSVEHFRRRNNQDWVPARQFDNDAVEDEYISAMTFTENLVNRGAFLDRNPYTRLVTYSNLNDLRAANETSDRIDGDDPRPGPEVTDQQGNPLGHRRPWVYLGPGLYFNDETRRIHIRLAHTHSNLSGVTDYDEETDPRRVPLAISPHDMVAVRLNGSNYVRLERLTVDHGGDNTIVIRQARGVTLDHVRVRAATRAVRMGSCADVTFAHCQFLGGVPTWMFRNDRTSGYFFRSGNTVVQNNLGEKTSETLLLGNSNNTDVEIHHCEFLNGHKVFLEGQDVDFHHNWLNNLQEDGLALGFDGGTTATVAKIHDNVFQRVSTGLSFGIGNQATQWRIYRNLFDLRARVRSSRPRHTGDREVFRSGQFHSGTRDSIGPHDIFQNTVLTQDQRAEASFLHYRDASGPNRRRCFNNIFVAVNPVPESDRAITFVPPAVFPGPTDGNLFHRIGRATHDPFRHASGTFASLAQLHASELFEQSKSQYPSGYEANSLLADPLFLNVESDLRLGELSPALAAGVRLPDDLAALDPLQPRISRPDIGCYPGDAGPLHVGVDGCRTFPERAVAPIARPRRLGGGVWKPVFLHEFQDGDPSNLKAVAGQLIVLPDGPVIEPTPDPADRGILMAPGNRLLSYRLAEPLEDVIGIDVSIDILYPEPNPFSEAVVPMVSLNPGALRLSLGRDPPESGALVARIVLNVGGSDVLVLHGVTLPPFEAVQTTRFRARWHTHGQVHLWQDGVLRAYRPGFAAGRTLTISELVVGIPAEVPALIPRYRVRRVLLKILRRDDARDRFGGQVSLDAGCQPPIDCATEVSAVLAGIHTRLRTFMADVFSALGTEPQAAALQSVGASAAKALSAFLESGRQDAADTFVQRVGEFAAVLADTDQAGFAELIADVTRRGEEIDPACRRLLEPLLSANTTTLQPLVRMLDAAWQRTLDARSGG